MALLTIRVFGGKVKIETFKPAHAIALLNAASIRQLPLH